MFENPVRLNQHITNDAGVERVVLSLRMPNVNAYAERWVRPAKDEALSRMMLSSKGSPRHVLNAYMGRYHRHLAASAALVPDRPGWRRGQGFGRRGGLQR
jgi:hypothetical protein